MNWNTQWMTEYQIVRANSADELEGMVNRLMDHDWRVVGGICRSDDPDGTYWAQAMGKFVETEHGPETQNELLFTIAEAAERFVQIHGHPYQFRKVPKPEKP